MANLKQNADEDICLHQGETTITATEKNKIDRQNKTNYQLAQIAGVSDKTVERYKKIQQDAQVPAYGNARGIHGLLLFHSPIFEPPLHAK